MELYGNRYNNQNIGYDEQRKRNYENNEYYNNRRYNNDFY